VKETRTGPDHFLELIAHEARNDGRGRLKIFFGACTGVGKTYAMLQAARQRRDDGVELMVGTVETHDREAIRALLAGLPELPLRVLQHRGLELQEFDLEGALAAHPQLILIDELAHANAPGSRHPKRWQDVESLLEAGIDVYTTLNVQHLESLNDIVSGIIGTRVRETVPDHLFEGAADVVLVDLPPDDLLARLHADKIHLPAVVESASRNFFRKGNLIALREMALRRVADRVNVDVRSYRIDHAIRTVWPTRERLLVCVRADPSYENLIREGARLAQHLQADWIVVHVDQAGAGRHPGARQALLQLAKLAESLGAEFANIPGEDVAQSLLAYVRARNTTKLVLGHSVRRWRWLWDRRLSDRIAHANPDIAILLLGRTRSTVTASGPRTQGSALSFARQLVLAILACAVTTLIASFLLRFFDLSNVVVLFLLTVILVALRFGRVAGALTALLSVASFDFFFVPPRFSFAVSDTQYLFTFVLILIVALVTGQLAAQLRFKAKAATAGEQHASAVARVARDLSGAIEIDQIAEICAQTIAPMFAARVALVLPDKAERLVSTHHGDFADLSVAQWVYDHIQPAGAGTQTLGGAAALYLPLKAPMHTRGVLALLTEDGSLTIAPDDRRLLDACCSLIALALERTHFVEIAQDTLVRMEGERLRNALLASVSHDLKTPLTAIRGLAETLETTDLPTTDRIAVSRGIRLQSEGLHRLVTNLLDLARIQSEGVRLNKEWNALDEIVGSALARVGSALADHTVHTQLPADLPLVEVDAIAFERVLVNLLDNAAKYTPRGSTISVRAKASGNIMRLFIEDNGLGLPKRDHEQLFEAFTRGARESTITGVGLGLALCRTIVAAHGGTIRAEQLLPHGASFEISLPLEPAPAIETETTA
jgi:two-component system sensor histidine kinase KdpD